MPLTLTAESVLSGNRRALAKAITLRKLTPEDREASQVLLNQLLPHTGKSLRIGITGVPGVGKSTFIEAFGQHLSRKAIKSLCWPSIPARPWRVVPFWVTKRDGALSRDPTPSFAPRQRVERWVAWHSKRENPCCCVRPQASMWCSLRRLAWVSRNIKFQYGRFLLDAIAPGGGDELQGIKKGILELADAIMINKADGESAA